MRRHFHVETSPFSTPSFGLHPGLYIGGRCAKGIIIIDRMNVSGDDAIILSPPRVQFGKRREPKIGPSDAFGRTGTSDSIVVMLPFGHPRVEYITSSF